MGSSNKTKQSELTYSVLKSLALSRLKEAQILYENGCYDGAVYLGGYVVETGLKACICKKLELDLYLDKGEMSLAFKTHNLSNLIVLAGLTKKLSEERKAYSSFYMNWSVITHWSETKRYEPIGTSKKNEAEEFISALSDPEGGVLAWIKKFW